jgi:hypothetical protein
MSYVATGPETAPEISPARALWLAWRNRHLTNLPVEIFNHLEAQSAELVAAIEELTSHPTEDGPTPASNPVGDDHGA